MHFCFFFCNYCFFFFFFFSSFYCYRDCECAPLSQKSAIDPPAMHSRLDGCVKTTWQSFEGRGSGAFAAVGNPRILLRFGGAGCADCRRRIGVRSTGATRRRIGVTGNFSDKKKLFEITLACITRTKSDDSSKISTLTDQHQPRVLLKSFRERLPFHYY